MRWPSAFAAIALAFTAPAWAQDPPVPAFVDETAVSGLSATYAGAWEQMVGGGVATFDCNGDARPDLLIAGGTSPASLWLNESPPGGALQFRRGGGPATDLTEVSGAYPLDMDSDTVTDLILLRVGENVVLRGLGDCRFERANESWGFHGGDGWSTALAATFEKGAAWPTIAVGNYIDRRQEIEPWGHCTANLLHRPAADGRGFAPPIELLPSHCALSMLFTDWNRSGTPALRVSNDREYYKGGQEQLWRLAPGAPPTAYTEAEGWQRLRIWGMGIAQTDLTSDGYPEFFLTSMADNNLQSLTAPGPGARPVYADIAGKLGTTAHRPYTGGDVRPSTGWHAQFEDVNNDARTDLFVAKGNVWDMPDFAEKDPNNLLLQRPDGRFQEEGDRAGVASLKSARGAALSDFNRDGLVDLIVVNRNAPAEIWRNTGPGGHWIALDLAQPAPNTAAIGAVIEVRAGDRLQRREITLGGGHAGGTLGPWHFGLGQADAAEVRITWPDGTEGAWQTLAADGAWRLTRDGLALPIR